MLTFNRWLLNEEAQAKPLATAASDQQPRRVRKALSRIEAMLAELIARSNDNAAERN